MAVVTGQIDHGFSKRLVALLAENPHVEYVVIESPGGNMAQAFRAAELLNQRRVEVRVVGRCASACAILWAAADRRSLVEGARIGLHASAARKETPVLLRGAVRRYGAGRSEAVLQQAGFPPATISDALATPHTSMLWLTSGELRALGVRFHLVAKGGRRVPGSAPNNSSKPTPLRGAA